MKKVLGMVVLLAMVAMFVVPAFADEATDNQAQAWFNQMFQNKKAWVDQAVKDGRLTTEQGKLYNEHFDQMYKFHQENGYTCPMGGPGGGMGYGRGFGSGMGNGPGYNAQQ
ncbi:conserved hypothetical protein [Desulforamulus reducens MI-1]|uniref:DUF2680 domain-containing protein n=1 Tax=Desulforamulus reducens (strain ATCC BAA-1160 / DSM 100696 / MI-1) TaxID=349161 RepID=A4J642_DESRM|nr:DUF2680 domain-containing protein [Desulforamulus reducens]ABO50545.1 conserved hypothetical protein [Desulforamulus reducens MI-1]